MMLDDYRAAEATIAGPLAEEPIAALARQANQLHDDYLSRYCGHVRLTRNLPALDRLIDHARSLCARAQSHAEDQPAQQGEERWQALAGILQRRLDEYTAERGAVAQIQAAAGTNDLRASALTSRSRLVLHRYVRHFAGMPRRSRDLQRLLEMTADLQALADALRPVSVGIHLRSVAEEIGAVNGFVAFFRAEAEEIAQARRSGSLADQSDNWSALLGDLHAGWQQEVLGQPPETRRLGLIDRYVAALDAVVDGLATVSHANLPESHGEALSRATAMLGLWQAVAAEAVALHGTAPPALRRTALLNRAESLWQTFRGRWSGELLHHSERTWLCQIADAMDEVERQLAELTAHDEAEPQAELARVRDRLVLVEKTFDGTTALVSQP